MYKVSVAIPAYNEEANIGMLLRALLSQNEHGFKLCKIVVASDGSGDKTVEVIKLFDDPRIEVLEGRKRIGQISRQNQMFDILLAQSDLILLLEADTLPVDNDYIANLVKCIPEARDFSYICGDTMPVKANNFVSHCLNVGYMLRKELFSSSNSTSNLYLATGGRLFSNRFASDFRWKPQFHEDSFCYRKAKESGLPIIFAPQAKTYFKSVETLGDYLKQSTKFQKAKDKEKEVSSIYKMEAGIAKRLIVVGKFLFKYPVSTSVYLLFFIYSRLVSRFTSEYDQFWSIYLSSKNLKYKQ